MVDFLAPRYKHLSDFKVKLIHPGSMKMCKILSVYCAQEEYKITFFLLLAGNPAISVSQVVWAVFGCRHPECYSQSSASVPRRVSCCLVMSRLSRLNCSTYSANKSPTIRGLSQENKLIWS